MKVFLSWSKDLSHEVAQYFAEWLPGVIQECNSPFISSDIDKGEPWFETITGNLGTTDIGLVFITAENQDAVWLNFEAGAMLNKFGKSGICPVLVGLKKGDYDGPLKNLQLTELSDESDVRQLLGTINKKCANPLDQVILDKMLNVFWKDLKNKISELIEKHAKSGHTTNARRDVGDKVDELLSLVRGLAAKDSMAEQALAESRHYMDFVVKAQSRPAVTKYVPEKGTFTFGDALDDGALARISNQEGSRKERLERFAEKHGSREVALKDTNESVVLLDVFDLGPGHVELLIKSSASKAPRMVSFDDVSVLPF